MATTINHSSLFGSTFWHTGSSNITYSFLGSPPPSYYTAKDLNGDGTDDAYVILGSTAAPDEIVGINADVSLNAAQTQAALHAIKVWNEVANFNLTPFAGGSGSGSGGTTAPITGNGMLVSGLGGPAGFGEIAIPRNDDGSTFISSAEVQQVFENGLNFFGTTYNGFYVNTNGSISFGTGIATYTPTTITAGSTPAILPFWADVDTRAYSDGSLPSQIYVDVDSTSDIITITWPGVDYYSTPSTGHVPKQNWFQLQLYDRGGGDFDIVFRYQNINWSSGDASGGTNGLGGTAAHMGWTAGNGKEYFQLPQSGNEAAVLNLENTPGNTGVAGLWVFQVRNGQVQVGDITFGAYDARSIDGTDLTAPTLPPNGLPQTELFGFAHSPGTLGSHDFKGDVWFNNNLQTGGQSLVKNPQYGDEGWVTFIHELGHALGFIHPNNDPYAGTNNNNQYTVMSYNAHPSQASAAAGTAVFPVTPMLYDIQAAQIKYGANMNTRTGDDVYFAVGGHFPIADGGKLIATIWDAGGNDTFDASAQSSRVTIDLRPGYFSTIGAIQNNIAIAKGISGTGAKDAWIENAKGGAGNDRLTGNRLDNVLDGNAGNDVLYGLGGNDTLYGRTGGDILRGGGGNDTLSGGGGPDVLYGGNDDDVLKGDAGLDVLYGEAGNDTLRGGDFLDTLYGGGGDDTLYGDADDDVLWGGIGNDTLHGGGGLDTLWGEAGDDSLYGGPGNDILRGNDGNDRLYGQDGDDTLSGGTGSDLLNGGGGTDKLFGMDGADILQGLAGTDYLYGGLGNDRLYGGLGNDRLHGDALADRLWGEEGRDVLYGGTGLDLLYGGPDSDVLWGGAQPDQLFGGLDDDRLYGENGTDKLYGEFGNDVLSGGNDADYLSGGGGNDILWGGDQADELHGGPDSDRLYGGNGSDTLYGESQNDFLYGNANDDILHGGPGNDRLYGGGQNDRLEGGLNNDFLDGGPGNDTLTGGGQADVFYYGLLYGADVITDFQNNVDVINLTEHGFASVSDALALASQVGGSVVFNFGGGHTLTVHNVSLNQLSDDIVI